MGVFTISEFSEFWVSRGRRADDAADGDGEEAPPSSEKPGEKPGDANEKSKMAFAASAKNGMKEHVEAHRNAAKLHSDAAEAHRAEGNDTAAHMHEMAAKDHNEAADHLEKKFGDSHLY